MQRYVCRIYIYIYILYILYWFPYILEASVLFRECLPLWSQSQIPYIHTLLNIVSVDIVLLVDTRWSADTKLTLQILHHPNQGSSILLWFLLVLLDRQYNLIIKICNNLRHSWKYIQIYNQASEKGVNFVCDHLVLISSKYFMIF